MAAALPRLLNERTEMFYRRDSDSHHRIMAKTLPVFKSGAAVIIVPTWRRSRRHEFCVSWHAHPVQLPSLPAILG